MLPESWLAAMNALPDAAARRAFWARQMDEAHDFMQRVRQQPVEECGEPLVSLVEAAQTAGIEIDFSTRPHVLGQPRLYYLRQSLVAPFLAAAREMRARGWVMRVEDGFRTCEMQRQLAREPYTFDLILFRVLWELHGQAPPVELVLRRLSALVANSPKVGTHMSGSAIDISVLDAASGKEIERGGPYLEMSELTPMASPYISLQAQENRATITALMAKHGFVAYPWEFWHYNSGDAYEAVLCGGDQPARYGPVDADLATGQVRPIASALEDLNSLEEIRAMLAPAMTRLAIMAGEQALDPDFWESTIADFEAQDRRAPPPAGAVVFTGSSSITWWTTLEQDMAPMPVINRGFGGSKIGDVARYAGRTVVPHRPGAVVLFAGTNDIAEPNPATAEAVFSGYRAFLDNVLTPLPETHIYYVGITPTPARWPLWPVAEAANRLIRAHAAGDPRLHYINMTEQFLGPDGQANHRLYQPDGVHPNALGYQRWTATIKPILAAADHHG
jgi:zinc D-Ala-D-Ala dipeptidase